MGHSIKLGCSTASGSECCEGPLSRPGPRVRADRQPRPRRHRAEWLAALVVDVLLATGIAVFVIPGASTVSLAAAYGALFGAVVYEVHDFTNYSTLRQWPFVQAPADVVWGAVASAACAAVRIVNR